LLQALSKAPALVCISPDRVEIDVTQTPVLGLLEAVILSSLKHATIMTTQTRKLGSLDFVRMIYDGHPEYSLLAVKAPIDDVVAAWIEFRESQSTRSRHDFGEMKVKTDRLESRQILWDKQIVVLPGQPLPEDEEEEEEHLIAQAEQKFEGLPVPTIEVADSEWVVMIRSLTWLDMEQISNVPLEAKFLSEKFQTYAFTMMEEDTSGAVGYELFDRGESIESLESCGGSDYRFTSQRQDDPQFKDDEDWEDEDCDDENDEDDYISRNPVMQFIDRVVADLGLYIPAVWHSMADGKPTIEVMPSSMGTIARADWLTVIENWEIAPTVVNDDDAE
jgi:hypothetical protein